MKNNKGFVLAETLIVVIILTVTLMSLYTSFAALLAKSRSERNNDTIDTIYKTYFIKDFLDGNYIRAYTSEDYVNSFLYYAISTKSLEQCKAYDYNGDANPKELTNESDEMLVCDYKPYLEGSISKDYSIDPLYSAIKSYNIEKIYMINYYKINNATNSNRLYNYLDASTIDYLDEQHNNLDTTYLVIKYQMDHSDPTNYNVVDDFRIYTDAYYSSIRISSIDRRESLKPVYLYESNTSTRYMTTPPLANDDEYVLTASNNFDGHSGSVIVGWISNKDYVDQFSSCLSDKSHYESLGINCYGIGETMKVSDFNRNLYAIWCGDGTLKGAIECQVDSNTLKSKGEGAMKDVYGDGYSVYSEDTNYTYRGTGGDNFVKIGDYCYRMMSTFGSTDSIKITFYGPYDSARKGCMSQTNFNLTSTFSIGQNTSYWAWMYANVLPRYSFGGFDNMANWLNLRTIVSYEANKSSVCKNGTSCYFGNDVKWDATKKEYMLVDDDGNEITTKKAFGSYSASNYTDLSNADVIRKYICGDDTGGTKGGQTTRCSTVYYYYSRSGGTLSYYYYKDGNTNETAKQRKVFLSKKIEYKNGKFYLSSAEGDYIEPTLYDLITKESSYREKVLTYRYACNKFEYREDKNYVCDEARLIASVYDAGKSGLYYQLTDGSILNYIDVLKYDLGTVSNRTKSSSLKTEVDKFYDNNLKSHESIIDMNATFCNDLTINSTIDDVKSLRYSSNNGQVLAKFEGGIDLTTTNYKKYKSCSDGYEYLYSYKNANTGNKLLDNPIGLITAQEAAYIGLNFKDANHTNYLYSESSYNTMTGEGIRMANGQEYYGVIIYNGKISSEGSAFTQRNTYPVIAIKIDKEIANGTGSRNNPFELKE